MSAQRFKVLLVEDEQPLVSLYKEYLKEEPLDITHASSGKEALKHLSQQDPDVILLDVRLPDMNGTEILDFIQERGLTSAVIMITAHGSINMAVETMRGGAYDFLVKPFNRQRLVQTLTAALKRESIKQQVIANPKPVTTKGFQGFIGKSKAMQVIYRMVESAAPSKATTFITGESGTGKEVTAEAIHRLSPRTKKPLVVLNCAAIPKDLMESEIFGHVKGAFTGAISDHEGAATQADGGTLFLDEVCEMDLHLQSKLLRFIQTGTFTKVGGNRQQKVDIRFICATNRDPLVEIGEGRFREDLYYRLHVIPIHLPPLRAREGDTLDIARKILVEFAAEENKRFRDFDPEVSRMFLNYPWPGNVRQLQNVIRNIVVLNKGELVTADMVPAPVNPAGSGPGRVPGVIGHMHAPSLPAQGGMAPPSVAPPQNSVPTASVSPLAESLAAEALRATTNGNGNLLGGSRMGAPFEGIVNPTATGESAPIRRRAEGILPLWETEKLAIEDAIESCGGNIPKAAALLGISASTIYRKRQHWETLEAKD
ncbi:MAG: sigma-54-dependent Fis family transcriptional regulator [Geminicoccus sp.]|nr:sigma-54-dependent Fis family transcriptional regulator [Geminicoccus sp.]